VKQFALVALPLLAACATTQPVSPAGGVCSNAALQQFVGQPATADLGARCLPRPAPRPCNGSRRG
jgi:hypothetical protein